MLSTTEIVELEKKVFKYRLKQKIHYIVYLVLVFLSMAAGVYFHYNPLNTSLKITITENNVSQTSKEIKEADQNLSQKQSLITTEEKNTTVASIESAATNIPHIKNTAEESKPDETLMLHLPILKPSMAEKKNHNAHTASKNDIKQLPKEEEIENRVLMRKKALSPEENFYRSIEETISTGDIMSPPPLGEDKPKGVIKIETQEVNSIQYFKEKFEKTHNIIFALMLAEEYYLIKNYEQSNKWALIANGIDSENEKSWIWFAKSKVKLGKKEDAVVALKAYLKNHKSSTIQSILNQITLGEIND